MDLKNRNRLAKAIVRIRQVLTERQKSEQHPDLSQNYAAGIRLCADMEAWATDQSRCVTESSLFSLFDRYSVDSRPWDKELFKIIDEVRKEAKSHL